MGNAGQISRSLLETLHSAALGRVKRSERADMSRLFINKLPA